LLCFALLCFALLCSAHLCFVVVLPAKMGIVYSKLFKRRKSISIYGLELEKLDQQVEQLKESKAQQLILRRNLIKQLFLFSSTIYMVLLGFLYLYQPNTKSYQLYKYLAILLFPVTIFIIHYTLSRYFTRNELRNEKKMNELETKRDEMLKELMDDEGYQKRQQLLLQYARKKNIQQQITKPLNINNNKNNSQNNSGNNNPNKLIRSSQNQQTAQDQAQTQAIRNNSANSTAASGAAASHSLPTTANQLTATDSRLLNRADILAVGKRGPLDKIVDYVLSDGPNSRYALICRNCFTHNGLVREEELNKLRYRCTYCNHINGPALPEGWKPAILPAPVIPPTPQHSNIPANTNFSAVVRSEETQKMAANYRENQISAYKQRRAELISRGELEDEEEDDSLLFSTKKPKSGGIAGNNGGTEQKNPEHSKITEENPGKQSNQGDSEAENEENNASTPNNKLRSRSAAKSRPA
jgi:hypothetical protein